MTTRLIFTPLYSVFTPVDRFGNRAIFHQTDSFYPVVVREHVDTSTGESISVSSSPTAKEGDYSAFAWARFTTAR